MREQTKQAQLHWRSERQRIKQFVAAVRNEEPLQRDWLVPTASDEDVPLLRLQRRLARTIFEYNSLLLATVATIDFEMQQWIGELQGEEHGVFPSFMLCQLLFCYTEEEREAALRSVRRASPFLLCFTNGFQYAHSYRFQVEPFIVDYIVKQEMELSFYLNGVELHHPQVIPRIGQQSPFCALQAAMTRQQRVQLKGARGTGRLFLVAQAAAERATAIIVLQGQTFPRDDAQLNIAWIITLAYLFEAIVIVNDSDRLAERLQDEWQPFVSQPLWRFIEQTIVFIVESPIALPFSYHWIEVQPYTYEQRQQLWARYSELTVPECAEMARLKLTPQQIRNIAATSSSFADHLQRAKRQMVTSLPERATFVQSPYTLQDVHVPDEQRRQLQLVIDHYRYRDELGRYEDVARRFIYGKGLSLLLSGPPGTGKTMIAHALANELALDLYRVDLAQIVSKYVGETEKQLSSLFHEAEKAHALLFFDETDALFGKRSEVKEAHDKYANLETSYLLQRIEQFDGVAVLATNLAQNIDEAFLRRITYSLHIPLPTALERERLWRSFFSLSIEVADRVDVRFLAETLPISGGYMKNIYWQAAVLAVREQQAIDYRHLAEAITLEYRKIGKMIPVEWTALREEESRGSTDCITRCE